jgi:hypothetical protein
MIAPMAAGGAAVLLAIVRRMDQPLHIFLVLIDELADPLGALTGKLPRIGDRAAEPDVVAHIVDAGGVLEQFIDIGLTNAKPSVDISPLVGLVPF